MTGVVVVESPAKVGGVHMDQESTVVIGGGPAELGCSP